MTYSVWLYLEKLVIGFLPILLRVPAKRKSRDPTVLLYKGQSTLV